VHNQEEIKGLRLSNNSIPNFLIFDSIEASYLDANKIQWIDLSFNQLKKIDENLAAHLPNVATLYLHANQIARYSDIRRLSCFTHIKSLTLYGNPVEEQKHYRNVVLYYFPNLTQLDFSVISPGEREKVASWAQIYRNCLSPDMQTLTF
jgi:Leucine-rich repeat (LRR) protein